MKHYILIVFLLLGTNLQGQNAIEEELINDIISNDIMKYSGEIAFSKSIDSSWVAYHLNRLSESADLTFKGKSRYFQEYDSLKLTEIELRLLENHFRSKENLTFNYKNHRMIEIDSVMSHLKKDRENQVVYLSHPIFIRKDSIAVIFFANFCCGGINGPANLSLYKKENGKWWKWIAISGGIF